MNLLPLKIKLMKPELQSQELRALPSGQMLTLGSVGYDA